MFLLAALTVYVAEDVDCICPQTNMHKCWPLNQITASQRLNERKARRRKMPMDEYQRLIMFLKIQIQNFGTLHRHLSGDNAWFENHEQLDEWQSTISEQCDDLTEIGMALGYAEPGIKDAVLAFGNELLDIQPRDCRETFSIAREIMRSVAGMMQAVEPIVPASVQNKLQEYEYFWNKEADYKIAQMLGGMQGGKKLEMEYDDD